MSIVPETGILATFIPPDGSQYDRVNLEYIQYVPSSLWEGPWGRRMPKSLHKVRCMINEEPWLPVGT